MMPQILSRLRDSLWHNTRVIMFNCPYCKAETDVVGTADFATIDLGRAICEHCGKEFIIVENLPMTEEQYRASKPQ
jgi:transcription elongation factor Elf1